MFMTCSNINNTSGGGGGGGSNTIINNYYYTAQLNLQSTNFQLYPVVSNHFSITGTVIPVAGNITTSGIVTFTFNEPAIFSSATLVNFSGSNQLNFIYGALTQTVFFTGATAAANIIFTSVQIILTPATQLSLFVWSTATFYNSQIYSSYPNGSSIVSLYNPKIINAVVAGGVLRPTNDQPISLLFATPAIIFSGILNAGFVFYNQLGNQTYQSSNIIEYTDPISRADFGIVNGVIDPTSTVTQLNYYCPYELPLFTTTTFDFTTPANYNNFEAYEFTTIGNNNSGSFNGTITFIQPLFITAMNFTGISNIIIDGDLFTTGSFATPALVTQLNVQNLTSMTYQKLPNPLKTINNFILYNFTSILSYTTNTIQPQIAGNINIENELYRITSTDQLNTPIMYDGTGLIVSVDGNAAVPTSTTGTINCNFKIPCYISNITFNGSGTLSIGGKTYNLPIINPNDFTNLNCYYTTSFSATYTGQLLSMILSADIQVPIGKNYLFTENFRTIPIDFQATLFDTNIATNLGTPQPPGVGAGGTTAAINNVYLGNATTSNINFNETVTITAIQFINCVQGELINFKLNGNTIDSNYLPGFGQNSVYTLSKIINCNNITLLNGVFAISAISYYTNFPYQIITIPGNATTNYINLNTNLIGNYILKIYGSPNFTGGTSASSVITAMKNNQSAIGMVNIQSLTASTGESILATWPANQPIQLYLGTTQTGNTGQLLYYKILIF